MAKRLMAYKQKISEEWLEKKNINSKNDPPGRGDKSDEENSEDPIEKKNSAPKK